MKENNEIITQCDGCGQFEIDEKWDGIYREIIRTGDVSHSKCPTCLEKALKELETL
jgi:hypothetical protein